MRTYKIYVNTNINNEIHFYLRGGQCSDGSLQIPRTTSPPDIQINNRNSQLFTNSTEGATVSKAVAFITSAETADAGTHLVLSIVRMLRN